MCSPSRSLADLPGKERCFKAGCQSTCRPTTTSIVTCQCGARSSAGVREELLVEQLAEAERAHPWRYWHSEEDAGIPV
jgi:hypothetical protein